MDFIRGQNTPYFSWDFDIRIWFRAREVTWSFEVRAEFVSILLIFSLKHIIPNFTPFPIAYIVFISIQLSGEGDWTCLICYRKKNCIESVSRHANVEPGISNPCYFEPFFFAPRSLNRNNGVHQYSNRWRWSFITVLR